MNAQKIIENIPWKRFSTPSSNTATDLKQKFQQVLDGGADQDTYKYIIDNVEHQNTLWRISPWALKLFIAFLEEEKTDKKQLLEFISVIFTAANYQMQMQRLEYRPVKRMMDKYSQIKGQFFDDENTEEFWEIYKSLHRYFINVVALKYISECSSLFENFIPSEDAEVKEAAEALVYSIKNPKQY